ncbi:MAG: H-NS histone family protein [Roseicyclus sp.]|jgi:DNA-binding protein H-NS
MSKTIEKMNLDELKNHQKEIENAIKTFAQKKRVEALAAVRQVAKDHGFVLEELLSSKPSGKTGTKGVAKYANPADVSQTWTGRGRQPQWIKDALAAGKPLESMAI